MTFYLSATILTELLLLAMVLHVLYYKGFTKTQKTWFLLTFLAIMVCACAEYAVHCGTYDPSFAVPLAVLTVFQFSLAPVLGVLFCGALGLPRQKKNAIIFLGVSFLVEAIAAPSGAVFYFDLVGYSRGRLFLIYEIFYFISLVYLIVNLFRIGKRFQSRDTRTIVMVVIILAAGIIPMTFYKINITYIAIAISASLCYIYYNDLVQQDIRQTEIFDMDKQLSYEIGNRRQAIEHDTGQPHQRRLHDNGA